MDSGQKQGRYLPYIDGLRAVAVTAVMVFHLKPEWLPGGFFGVDIFFVISGFVVSAAAYSRRDVSFRSFFASFLARRFLRIVPALMSMLIVTTLAVTLLIPDAWLSEDIHRTGRAAIFGVANIFLASRVDGYFAPRAEFNPFVHAWSLGVEEQFYLLFPGFIWICISRKFRRITPLTITVLLACCSFAYAWKTEATNSLSSFYLLGSRAWELLMGVMVFQVTVLMKPWSMARRIDRVSKAMAAITGLLMVGYGLWASSPSEYLVLGSLSPVLGVALLLAVSCGDADKVLPLKTLAYRPFRVVGRMSYSLYLWHWPVFVLFRWTTGLDEWRYRATAIAVVIILASMSRFLIERPFLHLSSERRVSHKKVLLGAIAVLLIVSVVNGLMHHHRRTLSLSTVARHAVDWYPTVKSTAVPDPCSASKPSISWLGDGRRMVYARKGCQLPADGSTVFVVGDSHALAFGRMFGAYAARTGRRVVVYDNAGCAYLSLQSGRETSEGCRSSSVRVTGELVDTIRPGDVVFLPSLRMPRFVDQWTRYRRDDAVMQALSADVSARESGLFDAAIRDVSRLTGKGARVVIEAPNLLLNAPAYRCSDPWTRFNPICAGGMEMDRGEFERLRRPMFDTIDAITRAVPGTAIFDPFPLLCPEGPTCTGFHDSRPLFFDADHISGFANEMLLPAFEAAMSAGMDSDASESDQIH